MIIEGLIIHIDDSSALSDNIRHIQKSLASTNVCPYQNEFAIFMRFQV